MCKFSGDWFCVSLRSLGLIEKYLLAICSASFENCLSISLWLIEWVGSGWCLILEFFKYSRCFQNVFTYIHLSWSVLCFPVSFISYIKIIFNWILHEVRETQRALVPHCPVSFAGDCLLTSVWFGDLCWYQEAVALDLWVYLCGPCSVA